MKLIGFNFSKISINKESDNFKGLKINTNINIQEIKEIKTNILKGKEEILGVKFNYLLNYEPNIAIIEFEGNILIETDVESMKDIIRKWGTKKISEDFKIVLFNIILRKCNIKSLQLEDEMNLPLHINLPSVQKEKKEE
ncbi:MAG TPA: hypothetical protein VJB35_05340 [Candidatus Nanoarchaeia archaeon]|nr:hypothetical protein [Candidatus Nanoarchaeia archaeon]